MKGGHNTEHIRVQEICVGAHLCKVSFWCVCFFSVGAAFCIRRQYRTNFEVVVGTCVYMCVCVHVWVRVQSTSDKQPALSPLLHSTKHVCKPILLLR